MRIRLFGRTFELTFGPRNAARMPASAGNDRGWAEYLSGMGYSVQAETALQISAVFRCVDIISKTIAAMPLHLYRNTPRGKEKATDHPLYQMVYALPNPQTTAYKFWQMYVANLLLTRAAFAKIDRDSRGHIRALWNIPTRRVGGIYLNRVNGERYIDVNLDDGSMERLHEGEFMYTPGFLFGNRNEAEDPIYIASEVLGLTGNIGLYARQAVNGVNPGGFIEYPAGLSDQAYERFKMEFEENYKGAMNAGKFLFLEEGGKANLFQRDLEKMQVLESRKWAVTEICRIFGVPAHLAMDMEHATFSNIEQQSLEYVRDCVNPMDVRLEQTMFRDLLTRKERAEYYFRFNSNSLLRGDTATRASYYNTMRQTGVMSANEVRRLEEFDERPEGAGADDLHVNGNMITLENARLNIPRGAKGA